MLLCEKYGAIHCVFNSKLIVDVIQNNKTTFLFYCLVIVSPVFPPIDCIKRFYSARKSMENKYLFYVWALHYLTGILIMCKKTQSKVEKIRIKDRYLISNYISKYI